MESPSLSESRERQSPMLDVYVVSSCSTAGAGDSAGTGGGEGGDSVIVGGGGGELGVAWVFSCLLT